MQALYKLIRKDNPIGFAGQPGLKIARILAKHDEILDGFEFMVFKNSARKVIRDVTQCKVKSKFSPPL